MTRSTNISFFSAAVLYTPHLCARESLFRTVEQQQFFPSCIVRTEREKNGPFHLSRLSPAVMWQYNKLGLLSYSPLAVVNLNARNCLRSFSSHGSRNGGIFLLRDERWVLCLLSIVFGHEYFHIFQLLEFEFIHEPIAIYSFV